MPEDRASTKSRVLPKPRRVRFSMPTSTKRQHFVDGDLVMSHFISVLSATFPEGKTSSSARSNISRVPSTIPNY